MGKQTWESEETWILFLVPLDKLHKLSEPQFSYLWNGYNNRPLQVCYKD